MPDLFRSRTTILCVRSTRQSKKFYGDNNIELAVSDAQIDFLAPSVRALLGSCLLVGALSRSNVYCIVITFSRSGFASIVMLLLELGCLVRLSPTILSFSINKFLLKEKRKKNKN